jgi:acylphosphatase
MITRHLLITGRVQGVGFRYHMRLAALERSVTGWVRNRRDGSVEAMVSGTPAAVEKIIAWARRGPESATVSAVEIAEADGSFANFDALPTE